MLSTRIFTAIILIIIVGAVLVYTPPWGFGALILLGIFAATYELLRFVLPANRPARIWGCIYAIAVAAANQWAELGVPVVPLLIGGCFITCLIHLFSSTTLEKFLVRSAATCFGAVYVGLGLSYFYLLRSAGHGRTLVVMTIGMAALSDTFAFAAGKAVGRRKLAPLVSPNKTVEGFLAGFIGSVVAGFICRAVMWPELPIWSLIRLGLLIGLVAPLGDLIESAIKRAYHVKDSGRLLPGHGGVLDRADAYIFSAPAVYYYVKYVMGVI